MRKAYFRLSTKGKPHEQNQTQRKIVEGGVRRPFPRKKTSAVPACRHGSRAHRRAVLLRARRLLSHRTFLFFHRALERDWRTDFAKFFIAASTFRRSSGVDSCCN